MQEHWLYQFELEDLNELLPGCKWAAKAVDEQEPILPIHKPRGRAGVVTIWKDSLDSYIEKHTDGSHRIQVVTINAAPPICLINVYMPTQNGSHTNVYASTLDEIHVIMDKFSTHIVVLGGDMNGSLSRKNPNKQDILLKSFCDEHELTFVQKQ